MPATVGKSAAVRFSSFGMTITAMTCSYCYFSLVDTSNMKLSHPAVNSIDSCSAPDTGAEEARMPRDDSLRDMP